MLKKKIKLWIKCVCVCGEKAHCDRDELNSTKWNFILEWWWSLTCVWRMDLRKKTTRIFRLTLFFSFVIDLMSSVFSYYVNFIVRRLDSDYTISLLDLQIQQKIIEERKKCSYIPTKLLQEKKKTFFIVQFSFSSGQVMWFLS